MSDPACCVINGGEIASAVEQAKVSHHQDRPGSFPDEALQVALDVAGVNVGEITCVAVARPFTTGLESNAQLSLRARSPK